MFRFSLFLGLILLGGGGDVLARPQRYHQQPSPARNDDDNERKQIVKDALRALDSVIDELPQIEDVGLRVAVAEGLVKTLAPIRPNQCRRLLDSLFDAARTAVKPEAGDDKPETPAQDRLVEKIVRLAALVDRKLAESYIEKYTAGKERDVSERREADRTKAALMRLRLAAQTLDTSPASSVSLAKSTLAVGVFPETLAFLGRLRQKDIQLANAFFGDAIVSVANRQARDANELMLLYAYVFSPLRVPVVTPRGIGIFNIPDYLATARDYAVDPLLARAYMQAISSIVLDPNRLDPDNVRLLKVGLEGEFYLISVLQAAAAQYLPALSDALLTRKSMVGAMLGQNRGEAAASSLDRWDNIARNVSITGGGNKATVDYFMERAEKTSDPVRKDQLLFRAANAAVSAKEHDRALKIAAMLSPDRAAQAERFIEYEIAVSAARDGLFDKAEALAKTNDDLVQRAFVFTMIAAGLLESRPPEITRAKALLEETHLLAAKLQKQEERAAVLFGVVSVAARFDPDVAMQALTAAVEAGNKLEQFERNLAVHRGFDIGGYLYDYPMYDDDFTFTDAINRLAVTDFNGTLSRIGMLKSRFARLSTTVLASSSVLARVK